MTVLDMPARPAIFLDRDGVINTDGGYTHRVEDFRVVSGAVAAVRRAHEAGYLILVVTNQGGIGLGLYGHADVAAFHAHIAAVFRQEGAVITDFAYCPHHPEAPDPGERVCSCRKPLPGMILTLADKHGVDLKGSAIIGDHDRDIEAGRAAGVPGWLFDGGDLDMLMVDVLAALATEGERG